jgi:hypothetical protein
LADLAIVGWSILESSLNTAGHVRFVAMGAALAWPAFRSYRKGRARQSGLGNAVRTMLRDIEAQRA